VSRSSHFARAGLLLASALVIAKLLATGQLHYFLSPSFDGLTAVTGLILAAMAFMEFVRTRRTVHAGHGDLDSFLTLGFVAVPLVAALLLSPRALGVSGLDGAPLLRLVLAFDGPTSVNAGAPPEPRQPIADVGDLMRYLRTAGESGVGQRVHARGLVARGGDLNPNEFVLVRYAIVHCVADAQPLGLLVVAPAGFDEASDKWVEVDGTLASYGRGADRLVGIAAVDIIPTEEPAEPYISAF
jgi:uncharacterized repeat protein (TIGR03943 family)